MGLFTHPARRSLLPEPRKCQRAAVPGCFEKFHDKFHTAVIRRRTPDASVQFGVDCRCGRGGRNSPSSTRSDEQEQTQAGANPSGKVARDLWTMHRVRSASFGSSGMASREVGGQWHGSVLRTLCKASDRKLRDTGTAWPASPTSGQRRRAFSQER